MLARAASLLLLPILCYAADNRSAEAFTAIRNNDIPALKAMLTSGFDPNTPGVRATPPLMYAAGFGSVEAVKTLLDAGADVNGKNAFDATALMWAVGDARKVKMLLDKGAWVDMLAKGERTALHLAAMRPNGEAVVRMLLAKGADPKRKDASGGDLLIYSSGVNASVAKMALTGREDVNFADRAGFTPLMNAVALGDVALVRSLLAKGADPNAVTGNKFGTVKNGSIDLGAFTALMFAATYGPVEIVDALLNAGAKIDAKDIRGMTPIYFAMSSDRQDPAVIRRLLAAKPDLSIAKLSGEGVAEWSSRYGHPEVTKLMKASMTVPMKMDLRPAVAAKDAVESSLGILSKTSSKFLENGGCVACHAQTLTSLAMSLAGPRGVAVNPGFAKQMEMEAKGFWQTASDANMLRQDPPGGVPMMAYALLGMKLTGYKPDLASDSMILNILAQQFPDGGWHSDPIVRAPMEDSAISRTAMTVEMIQYYKWPGQAAELTASVDRARRYLAAAQPFSNEDRAFQILGLAWAGDKKPVAKLARDLVAQQHPDGGWGQSPYLPSDAYATGQALYALAAGADFKPTDSAFKAGADYLLRTQAADGSWHVKSRSTRLQPYFQSGFPYDHDQWISMAGTAWATVGLVFVLPQL